MNGRMYAASDANLAITDTGDMFQLRNGASVVTLIKEIRVFQESDTALAMNALTITRGAGGTSGTALTEHEFDIADAAAGATAFSDDSASTAIGVSVGTADWQVFFGWNILQEFVWLPTPETQLWLANSDHLGVALRVSDTLTCGFSIVWEEFGT